MTDREYEVGESITVPWGLDTVEGRVVGAYGEGTGRRVLVEVNVGDGVIETIPFPQRALDAVRRPEAQSPPGTWVKAARYEEQVHEVLMSMLRDALPTWQGETRANLRLDYQHEIDIMASLPDRQLLVEAKYYSSKGYPRESSGLDRLASMLMHLERGRMTRAVGILVMNNEPPEALDRRASAHRRNNIPVWVAGWSIDNPDSGEGLRQAVEEAVNYRFPLTASRKEPG